MGGVIGNGASTGGFKASRSSCAFLVLLAVNNEFARRSACNDAGSRQRQIRCCTLLIQTVRCRRCCYLLPLPLRSVSLRRVSTSQAAWPNMLMHLAAYKKFSCMAGHQQWHVSCVAVHQQWHVLGPCASTMNRGAWLGINNESSCVDGHQQWHVLRCWASTMNRPGAGHC